MRLVNRRRFLWSTGAGIGLAAIGSSRAAEKKRSQSDHQQVRHALTGPISSIGTPFRRDGEVDYPGLRKIIDGCIELRQLQEPNLRSWLATQSGN